MRRVLADSTGALGLQLAHEFSEARLLCSSPDGRKLCLEEWKARGAPVKVVETGTWQTLYTDRFQQRSLGANFFADGEALFLSFVGAKGLVREVAADIRTSQRTERTRPYDPLEYSEQATPVDDRILVVARFGNEPRRLEFLTRLRYPDYRELSRVTIPPAKSAARPSSDLSVSSDRSTAVYFSSSAVVCRRTDDLSIVWNREIDGGLRAFPLAVSANGDHVAAVMARASFDGKFEHYERLYTSILDGKTGAEAARLPVFGKYGIAISPTGKLLALITDEPGEKGAVLPTVHIYDVPSGKRLGSVVHDQIPRGRRQAVLAGCGVSFTSDGKYLVTSGMMTKVWNLGD
jgi:hypothetical protein